jgi:hypothetical protein
VKRTHKNKKKAPEKNNWGPIEVERIRKRGSNDGRTILEKAQDIKRKWCEGEDKGIKPKTLSVSCSELIHTANVVGISRKDGSPVR